MKKYLYRSISVLLSLMMVALFCPFFTIHVYAVDDQTHGGGGHDSGLPDNFITDTGSINWDDDGVWGYIFEYLCANLGAIYSGDFEQVFKNDTVMKQYMIDHTYVTNEGDDENPSYVITFDADLIKQIKQALKEYQEERYGYMIQPTVSVEEFSTYCTDGLVYRSLVNIVKDSGIVAVYPGSSYRDFYLYDLSPYIDGTAGFVYGGDYHKVSGDHTAFYAYLYDFMSWQRILLDFYSGFYSASKESSFNSLEELKELGYCHENYDAGSSMFSTVFLFSYNFGNFDPYWKSRF